MSKIIITDEEMLKNKLSWIKTLASLASYIDKKVGYITKLLKYEYNPLTFKHEFTIERF